MNDNAIPSLKELGRLRTAPELSDIAQTALRKELADAMADASWFTVGVMAPSADAALASLRRLERYQGWDEMNLLETPEDTGPVFL